MNLKLEAIVVPVSDVDRAKKFYQETLGLRVDVDHRAAEQALPDEKYQRGIHPARIRQSRYWTRIADPLDQQIFLVTRYFRGKQS